MLNPRQVEQAGFETIGSPIYGGQSIVYRAHHRATEQTVALKVFHPTQQNKRALKEAAALAGTDHPNLANFVCVGYIENYSYIESAE